MTKLILILTILTLASSLSIKNRKIIDEQGRELTIHGTNIVVKVPPYQPRIDHYDPQWSFSKEDVQNCTKWGYNGIRLGMMWAGVEPRKDWYNETYLDNMEKLINMAGEKGIYTLIDFHQDLISEKFCGDGIPIWLVDQLNLYRTFPFPMGKKIKLNQSGLPSWDKCDQKGWGKYYFSYDVGRTFDQLYRVGSYLNKKFSQFWLKIASRFKGNPYVLGYQLINEPFVGNAIRDITLVIPSVAQHAKFQSFYDNLSHQIRSIDPDTLIFFQPITFDNDIKVGFTHPPGGKRFADKSVLAYHYYHPPALGYGTIDKRVSDGERLNVVSFLSEFGGSDPEVLGRAMRYQQSWLYWEYKSFGKGWGGSYKTQNYRRQSSNQFRQWGIDANHSMTYLQRIAGKLLDEDFNFKTKHYISHYQATPNGVSVLYYCAPFNYPNGHELEISPKSEVNVREVRPGYYEIGYAGAERRIIQVSLYAL